MPHTLIFLPGLGFKSNVWDKVVNLLPKDNNKYIKQDIQEYCTKCPYTHRVLNFDTYPVYLNHLLKTQDIQAPFTLVGHSLGGAIAACYAAKYPNKVSSLVLVSTPLGVSRNKVPLVYKASAKYVNQHEIAHTTAKKVIKALDLDTKHDLLGFISNGNMKAATSCYLDVFKYDFEPIVNKIKCPTLLVYGLEDHITFKHVSGTFLYDRFKTKKIVGIKEGHSIPTNSPEILAREITEFIPLK